jgi:NADH dehydrogenase
LDAGHRVRALTNSPQREHPLQGRVEAASIDFDDESKLAASLEGAAVLYNTYWVRFNHPRFKYADAVKNTLTLFRAAVKAGVPRVVHVSITNPSEDSPFEYFSGKARLERALRESGMSYAILRPTVIFGDEDILINNIAWVLRRRASRPYLRVLYGARRGCHQPPRKETDRPVHQ